MPGAVPGPVRVRVVVSGQPAGDAGVGDAGDGDGGAGLGDRLRGVG